MKSTFRIEITTSEHEGNWTPSGIDQVVYMISTNPGEPLRQRLREPVPPAAVLAVQRKPAPFRAG